MKKIKGCLWFLVEKEQFFFWFLGLFLVGDENHEEHEIIVVDGGAGNGRDVDFLSCGKVVMMKRIKIVEMKVEVGLYCRVLTCLKFVGQTIIRSKLGLICVKETYKAPCCAIILVEQAKELLSKMLLIILNEILSNPLDTPKFAK